MDCNELVELASDYLEARLPAAESRRLEDHLAECPGCVTYLDQIRAVIAAAGEAGEEGLSPEAEESLLEVFRRWKEGERP